MSEHFKTYKPKPCEGDDSLFEGEVVLMLPDYDQRMALLADNPEFFDDDIDGGDDKDKPKTKEQKVADLKKSMAVSKWSYQFYKKVDVKRKSDGFHFKSLEDLKLSKDCAPIIADIASVLSMGFELGN